MTYTIPLALQDFVPVLCAGLGFFMLADVLSRGHGQARALAFLGASLITLGGLLKASWKLTIAASGRDLVPLDKQLFFTLAVGFICLATALVAARRGFAHPFVVALGLSVVAVSVGLTLFMRGGGLYRAPLIALMVIGNTTTLLLAMGHARARRLPLAMYLIATYLVTGFIMSSLGRLEQTIALQWVEQSVNCAGSLGLLFGSRMLRRAPLSSPAP